MKESDIRNSDTFNQYLLLVEEDTRRYFLDKSRFVSVVCVACGAKESHFQFEKSGFKYVMCDNCATLYVNPRPPQKDIASFATSSKSSDFWINKFFLPMLEARREKIFKPRAQLIAEKIKTLKNLRIGDIGAGFGLFLEEIKKIEPSIKPVAVEPSATMADILRSKGLETINAAIEDVEGMDEEFDLLTAFELAEHLFEPEIMFSKAYAMLKPKGLFILTTLNCEGFDIQMLWERSKNIYPPQHINFFNQRSIAIALRKRGFVVEEIMTPGRLDWEIVENAIEEGRITPGRFWLNFSQNASVGTKQSFQEFLAEKGFSSHMLIIARK